MVGYAAKVRRTNERTLKKGTVSSEGVSEGLKNSQNREREKGKVSDEKINTYII